MTPDFPNVFQPKQQIECRNRHNNSAVVYDAGHFRDQKKSRSSSYFFSFVWENTINFSIKNVIGGGWPSDVVFKFT